MNVAEFIKICSEIDAAFNKEVDDIYERQVKLMRLDRIRMDNLEYDKLFPKLVEIRRKTMSQTEVAKALGISPQSLSRIEHGRCKSLYVFNVYMDTFGGELE